jgi:hypothetical protein
LRALSSTRPLEGAEQALYFQWLEYVRIGGEPARPHFFAVPNGGSRHRIEAARMKAQGVTPGVADIFGAVPAGDYHGLVIEMKRLGEKATELQLEQLDHRRRMGYRAVVVQGFDEARRITVQYLAHGWVVVDRWVG